MINTPGQLLKQAREKKGLSIADAAARLCIKPQFLENIEQDDYSHLSARTYARGYVLSYAHLLEIPEAQILPALNDAPMDFDNQTIPNCVIENTSSQRSSLLLWGGAFVVLIFLGLVLLWFRSPKIPHLPLSHSTTATTTTIPSQSDMLETKPAAPTPAPKPESKQTPKPQPTVIPHPNPMPHLTPYSTPPKTISAPTNTSVVQPSDIYHRRSESVALPQPRDTQ